MDKNHMSYADAAKQGQLLGTAHAVLATYAKLCKSKDHKYDEFLHSLFDEHIREMNRLVGNMLQLRSDIGDAVQLAGLIIHLMEGYRSTALDAK
jgi:hypothetical protein